MRVKRRPGPQNCLQDPPGQDVSNACSDKDWTRLSPSKPFSDFRILIASLTSCTDVEIWEWGKVMATCFFRMQIIPMYACTHTCMQHTQIYTCTCKQRCTGMHACIHMHARPHIHIKRHTYIHRYMHMHAHACPCIQPSYVHLLTDHRLQGARETP